MPLLTEILKPEKFNSTTLAICWYENEATELGLLPWNDIPGHARQVFIDRAQEVLDRLREEGVIR